MTYSFKIARRLARFRSGALLATFLLAACADGSSPSGPDGDPTVNDPNAVNVLPDSASVGTDEEVQFTAAEADGSTSSYRWWWGSRVKSVDVSPDSVRLARGQSRDFDALGKSWSGDEMLVTFQWKATGGTVDQSGKYVAGRTPGKYIVVATAPNGKADTATVVVTDSSGDPGSPDGSATRRLVLTPGSATLYPGGQQQYVAEGQASDGSSFAVTPRYQAAGGTISNGGMYTAGGTPGTYDVIATDTETGLADTASVTIAETDGGGTTGSYVGCQNLPAATRTVNVSGSSALASALANARAGDRIVLAAGSYSKQSWSGKNGTSTSPIVLCGPSTAVFTGDLRPTSISWWIFQGFSSRGAFQAFYAKGIQNTKLQGLEISNVGQEAVHFLCNSTDNVLRGSYIHHTGLSKPSSGEAVYLGTYPRDYEVRCGTSATDRSDRNQILDNRFGDNVSSEDVDAKEGTTGGVIRGNTSSGRGKNAISGHFEASIAIKSNTSGYIVENNTLSPAAQDGSATGNGIYVYSGGSATVRGNTISMSGASGYGIRMSGSGTVSCTNQVSSGRFSNVSCR
jgi:hypothetical protein